MHMQVSYSGIITAFQAEDESSILSTCSKFCGISIVVVRDVANVEVGVRFPYSAPQVQ